MIASGLKRGQDRWGTEKQTIEQERAQYRADLDEMYTDLRGEPKAFLEKLAQHDPRYRAFLETPAAPAQAVAPTAEMPAPDVTLHDGSQTYSLDGLKKLLEWNTANVEARLMPKLDERLKPWQDREKEAKAREEYEKAKSVASERARSMMAEAQNWPGFKEHEADILKALQADTEQARAAGKRPTLSLDAAYRQAVLPKMTADRNKMREELLKEINGAAAKTPTTTHGGAEVVKKQGPADTRSIASRVIDQLGG
jgi:type II secretory pathway component PulK